MNHYHVPRPFPEATHSNERILPIVPFLTGLIAGPLIYNAFQPYYGYPTPYPYPYPVPVPYGYGYGYY